MAPPEDPSLSTTHDLSLAARERRGRIWIDGCFDFAHHGHAGAMLQARQLGTALYVGVHTDEAITLNKGPPVMALDERIAAVDACRWATQSDPHAPYVTQLAYIDQWDTQYVVHGDDITADADGNDCYRYVKQAGRFLVVKRTPGISTTDLVGRMLANPTERILAYHVHSLPEVLAGREACASGSGAELSARIAAYATDATGLAEGVAVWNWSDSGEPLEASSSKGTSDAIPNGANERTPTPTLHWHRLVPGRMPRPDQRLVYVDGGWDLFCSGHIAFLQAVVEAEESRARKTGWFADDAVAARVRTHGKDYAPAYVVAGVHTDREVHAAKKGVFPVMSIFERGLCILQCRYIDALVFSAPRTLSREFLGSFAVPAGTANTSNDNISHDVKSVYPAAVYHGPLTPTNTNTSSSSAEPPVPPPYEAAAALGIFATIPTHPWQDVHAETIVARILHSRAVYEERQRIKGVKGVGEGKIREEEELKRG